MASGPLSTKNKILFLGTPEVAAETLSYLVKSGLAIDGIITRPDKPSGRHQELTPPPVKVAAQNANIPVYQPQSKQELHDCLTKLQPDLIITVAYGMILTQPMIDIPKFGILNLHYSLLPKYRGAAPYIETILNGDKETGVSVAKTVLGLDEGDILSSEVYPLSGNETAGTLLPELTTLGADLLAKTIPDWLDGKITPTPQQGDPTFTRMIKKEAGHIDWTEPAEVIERKVRAYNPWPSAFTFSDGKRIKIIRANTTEDKLSAGKVDIQNGRLLIGTGTTALEITDLQPEGKNVMSAVNFLNGKPKLTIFN